MSKIKQITKLETWEERFDRKFKDPVKLSECKCCHEVRESFIWANIIKRFIRAELKKLKT